MIKIKRALISVAEKTGILKLARELNKLGAEIISTGGTGKLLKEDNIPVREVSDYTGFAEMLEGRVKTLHPKIHAGLLALRNNPKHLGMLKEKNIGLIDMVVVSLYPFARTISKPNISEAEAIENIDIGGVALLRSAAKNFKSVVVVSSPSQYSEITQELKLNQGSISEETARQLAKEIFRLTSSYDHAIYQYLNKREDKEKFLNELPEELNLEFVKWQELRYGENPHQKGAFYKDKSDGRGISNLKQFQGKKLSFNNILDLNSAWELIKEFKNPAAVIVKHNSPCGVAEAKTLTEAYQKAWESDTLSAFGGVVGLNRPVDIKTAKIISASGFLECIIAPGLSKGALKIFAPKKNLRLLELKDLKKDDKYDFRKVSGGLLLQDKNIQTINQAKLRIVTQKKPTKVQLASLIFAWKVAKHVQSNAIVLARGTQTVGIGAGQMSRVDSVIIARKKAGKRALNSCLASDGFFPKSDSIIQSARAGVRAIIQPGGSIADKEIIKTCNKYKIAMVFTGIRHFKH